MSSYISPTHNKEQAAWLQLVAYHSQSGSNESQQCMAELANNVPVFDPMDVEGRAFIARVQTAVRDKTYDPQLSPDSKGLLNKMVVDPSVKPACARKLDFGI